MEDAQYYSQPVVLLDSEGEVMSLDQQMQYMRERSDKYQNLYHLVETAVHRRNNTF